MEKQKKAYYFNVVEAKDGKIAEVFNFNFGGHHDLADIYNKIREAGLMEDKYAKELTVAVRLLHHVMKKNPDLALFSDFAPQFKAFKENLKGTIGCGCGCK